MIPRVVTLLSAANTTADPVLIATAIVTVERLCTAGPCQPARWSVGDVSGARYSPAPGSGQARVATVACGFLAVGPAARDEGKSGASVGLAAAVCFLDHRRAEG